MNYFLIDYENVNVSGFEGITKLTAEDTVIVFYSEKAETLTFGLHRRINESKAVFQFQKVDAVTKNALDFQLCSFLGYLIRDTNNSQNNYYIVSHDNGYAVLSEYWKKRKINVRLINNLTKEELSETQKVEQLTLIKISDDEISEAEKKLQNILNDKTQIDEIFKMIPQYETKTDINNALVKKFTAQKGGELYRAIKPLLKDKK